jgi:hypothetical protein
LVLCAGLPVFKKEPLRAGGWRGGRAREKDKRFFLKKEAKTFWT